MFKVRLMKFIGFVIGALVLLKPEITYSQKAPQLPAQVVMGGPISLSGPYAKEGSQGLWGFQVAEKWINEVNGGIRIEGKKIPVKYVHYDDESKKESVTSLLERLAGTPVTEKYKAFYNSPEEQVTVHLSRDTSMRFRPSCLAAATTLMSSI